jgi:16S rRNA (guanine966-N2)-methyltransferase
MLTVWDPAVACTRASGRVKASKGDFAVKRQDQAPVHGSGRTPGNKQVRTAKKAPGSVRIIGGQWRGRRLPVPDIESLRPSGDRCRETLFNWLQPFLRNAKCVDLFAGTGVLGIEAVSRGAAHAVLVEKSRAAATMLRRSVAVLATAQVSVVEDDALGWLLQQAPASMDIVFLDPPFALNVAEKVIATLAQSQALRPGGLVYLESAAAGPVPAPGRGWEVLKEQQLGEVRMQLFKRLADVQASVSANVSANVLADALPA